jgi:hypothetical protein
MIIHAEPRTNQSSGLAETKEFGMQQSRKAFQILSDLYSDKPLAIVRELGCNALDSHGIAGKANVPFIVHLPNALEPWLKIQDFGTGIAHSDIYTVYANYFASTKTETNSQIGCLGLGSKSPFCYAENFVVESIVDGQKRIYNAFFSENGLPSISLMGTTSTTESNGLSIQIPVRSADFTTFRYAVQKAFRFFVVKPSIVGGEIDWSDEKPSIVGDDWETYKSFRGSAFATMGGVCYPIDIYKLTGDNIGFIRNRGLVMHFQIGELDFTPSREALSYDDSTIKNLNEKIERIRKEFSENMKKFVADAKDIYSAIQIVTDFRSEFHAIAKDIVFMWGAEDISNPHAYIQNILAHKPWVQTLRKNSYRRPKFVQSSGFTVENEYVWFINDIKKNPLNRLKYFLENNHNNHVMWFHPDTAQALIDAGFPADLFTHRTSDLPDRPRDYTGQTRGGVKVFPIFKLSEYSIGKWNSVDFDKNNPPKYFIRKSGRACEFTITCNGYMIFSVSDLKNLLTHLDIVWSDICLVTDKKAQTLLDSGSIDFQEFLETQNFMPSGKDIANFKKYHNISNLDMIEKVLDMVDNNHPLSVYAKIKQSIQKIRSLPSFMKRAIELMHSQDHQDFDVVDCTSSPIAELIVDMAHSGYVRMHHFEKLLKIEKNILDKSTIL